MYSNRYVAIHCCKEIYCNEIKNIGISRETKAVFLVDLNNIEEEIIFNTLAVLIYHGIGIEGWKKILNSDCMNYNYCNNNLIIVYAFIKEYQEKTIIDNNITNYYKIKSDRTLNYYKVKEIGAIKKIEHIEKIKLSNIILKCDKKINLAKDRFFIKNTYDNINVKHSKTAEQIKKICYKIASENISNVMQVINRISLEGMNDG